MIDKLKRYVTSRDITIRKVAPGTFEQPNPRWVQTGSTPDCCPIIPGDQTPESHEKPSPTH